jgi:uncharacterized membrane protein YadS
VFLVAVVPSTIGLFADVAALRGAGQRPLLLAAVLWITSRLWITVAAANSSF